MVIRRNSKATIKEKMGQSNSDKEIIDSGLRILARIIARDFLEKNAVREGDKRVSTDI